MKRNYDFTKGADIKGPIKSLNQNLKLRLP
jgi:hypothetical protein